MVRAAALVSGDGASLQAVLDAMYFDEIPEFQLASVISSSKDAYAMTRAVNAGIPAFVVDPELFPNITSHSMAVANKLKDMDIDLVIICGYELPLGVIPYQFRHRIIGTCPALYPAFDDYEGDINAAVLDMGLKITGATVYFAADDGRVGPIILQKHIDVLPGDDAGSLGERVMQEGEWKILPRAVSLFCEGRLEVTGGKVFIRPKAEPDQTPKK